MEENNVYLGDGVYATNDGYQVWLAVNDPSNNVIALDEDVLKRLINYAKSINVI